jgi:hypothetical protein
MSKFETNAVTWFEIPTTDYPAASSPRRKAASPAASFTAPTRGPQPTVRSSTSTPTANSTPRS